MPSPEIYAVLSCPQFYPDAMRNAILSSVGGVEITYSGEPMTGDSLFWGLIPLLLFISGKYFYQIFLFLLRTGIDQGGMRPQMFNEGCLVLNHLLESTFRDTHCFNQGTALFQ
jgi:hypothetical protein